MSVPNTTYRILTEKLGDSDPAQFIGNEGEVFYDPNSPELKLSDGSTSGGILIAGSGGGAVETAGYRGFSAFVNRFWGDDPSINQIIIYKSFWEDGYDSGYETKPIFWNSTTDTDEDDFGVGGIKTSNIICIINVYGALQEVNENSDKSPVPIANLQNFVKKFVDVALYDENGYIVDNIETAVQAFYDNIDALKATLPPLYENFEFDLLDNTNNISDGGDDQYDGGNYINSRGNDGSENLEIPYGDGTNVLNDYFGNGSVHKTFYQDSIWGMMVYDAAVDSVWYTGNIGADGYGNKQSEVLIGSSDNVNYVRYPKHNIGSNNYTLALSDAGRFIYADNNTITIPYNYDAPFPVGTEIKIVTQSVGSMVQIDGGSTSLYVNGTYESGFILPPRCIASLLKVEEEVWTIEVSAGGSSSQWTTETNGIYYESRVAIGTTAVGAGSTVLYVEGDARITGILTVGTASITLDGSNNLINVGPQVSIDGNAGVVYSTVFVGDGSGLVGIVTDAVGTEIYEDGNVRGTATQINFGNGFNVDPVTSSCANVNIGLDGNNNFIVGGGGGGCNNNFFGYTSGCNNTGSYNNFFGNGIGRNNVGCYNNFFGGYSGQFNTTGCSNNFIGEGAGLSNTTGSRNNFIGRFSGSDNTTGSCNNFFGLYAGRQNTTGCYNNFFGTCAGYYNTTGGANIFMGWCTGKDNTTGNSNTFVGGVSSGQRNTTGGYNSFFGVSSGSCNTTGFYNNFFGAYSGFNNDTGSRNIFLGSGNGISTSASYKVIIGSSYNYFTFFDSPDTTKDTQLAIGVRTDANPANYWIVGNENFNVGIGTTNPTSKLHVGGTVTANDFNSLSDSRFKTNIHIIQNPIEKLMKIDGVTFNWKESNKPSMGVIADEIEKVIPELVDGGEIKTVNYNGIIALLIECIKFQQNEIDSLRSQIDK
jgi:hypothetical protein